MRNAALLAVSVALLAAGGASGSTTGSIAGKITCRGVRDCAGAVVHLVKAGDRAYSPAPDAVMDQVRLTFTPHVLPVIVGTRVAFPNSDEVRHNVFSPSPVKRFNLGTYPKGVVKHVVFDKPGVVELLCNVHADMSAYIVVTETPYAAVVGRDGGYAVKDVPPGTYTVAAWRAELKEQRQSATVRAGETVALDFELRR